MNILSKRRQIIARSRMRFLSLMGLFAITTINLGSMSLAHAQEFNAKEFLKMSEGQQHWWYMGAIESIGHMVVKRDEKLAQCIWSWLPTEPEKKKDLLKRSFEMYPDYAPTTILMALLQRDCGTLIVD